jgi:aryl-alcohol dehydrogenase-like predicted oxidoreductase
MKRRDFLARGAAGAIALHRIYAEAKPKEASDRIILGPRKVNVSRLAMGTGTNGSGGSSDQTRKLGVTGLADMFKFGYDNGITFWDTADQYGSHPHLREALKYVKRENVTIMTKTSVSTAPEMKSAIDRYRRELNTDYIDILLLHRMEDGNWPDKNKGAMDAISEAQERGIVHSKGTSCHTLEALKTAASTKWVEIDLARINPFQVAMDAEPEVVLGVLKQMKAAGKGVVGMKILGAGKLRGKVDECLQYALAHSGIIDCFTIGAESPAELAGLIRKIPAASLHA